jgi:hypothetical protein
MTTGILRLLNKIKTSSEKKKRFAHLKRRVSSHLPELDGFFIHLCRNWHHTALLPKGMYQLVVEVSKGLSLHLSG